MYQYLEASIFLSLSLSLARDGSAHVPLRYNDVIETDQSEVTYRYAFSELQHRSAILCPSGFFIAEIAYRLSDIPNNKESVELTWTTLHLGHIKLTSFDIAETKSRLGGPCGTLVYCLGYQACVFSLSVEFCLQDPAPGYRKLIYANVTCARRAAVGELVASSWLRDEDAMTNDDVMTNRFCYGNNSAPADYTSFIREKMNKVIFIKAHLHDSTGSEQRRQTVDRDIEFIVSDESEIFNLSCPSPDAARSSGYEGSCFNQPPDVTTVTDETWLLLARAEDPVCREQLLQVYCSYRYDGQGNCRPPFVTQPQVQKGWSFISQPELGPRPDDKVYQNMFASGDGALVPARLAFVVLVHKSPEALIELAELLYRPQHFYAIHVDFRSDIRQTLKQLLYQRFNNVSNIRILERSRSFTSSWGSYGIIRAVTEAAEQLLRMGLWDFMITLSSSDLPLRNVDDLAKSLGLFRGRSFISTSGKSTDWDKDMAFKFAWHGCGGHVYNITSREKRLEAFYHSSTWAVYSRSLVELFVQPEQDGDISAGLMYYLQTNIIPDESYYATLALNTRHRDNITFRGFTLLKPFVGEDSKNLCRHRDETDTCGRGPPTFVTADIGAIPRQSHIYFFARKFSTNREDGIRRQVIESVKNDFYKKDQNSALPGSFISALASLGLELINQKYNINYDVDFITDLSVVPRLVSEDPCSQIVLDNGHYITQDYNYWMDMILKHDTQTIGVRALMVARKPLFYTCYHEGHIRAIQVTTRSDIDLQNLHPGPSRMTTPMPYEWSGSAVMWINIAIHNTDSVPEACRARRQSAFDNKVTYAMWPKEPLRNESSVRHDRQGEPPMARLSFLVNLISPDGTTSEKYATIEVPPPTGDHNRRDVVIHSEILQFGPFYAGWWTVRIKQTEVDNAYVYQQRILLLPRLPQHDLAYDEYLGDEFVRDHFKVNAAAFLSDLEPGRFYPDMNSSHDNESLIGESLYGSERYSSQLRPTDTRHRQRQVAPPSNPERDGLFGGTFEKRETNLFLMIAVIVATAATVCYKRFQNVIYARTSKQAQHRYGILFAWNCSVIILIIVCMSSLTSYLMFNAEVSVV